MERLELLKDVSNRKRKIEKEVKILSELINEQTKLKDKILIFEEIFAANKNPLEYMNDYFNKDNPGFIFICKIKFIELLEDEDFNILYPSIKTGISHKSPGIRFAYSELLKNLSQKSELLDKEFKIVSDLVRTISKDPNQEWISGCAYSILKEMNNHYPERAESFIVLLKDSKKSRERLLAISGAEYIYLSGKKKKGLELLWDFLHDKSESNKEVALATYRFIAEKVEDPAYEDYKLIFNDLSQFVKLSINEKLQNNITKEIGLMTLYHPEIPIIQLTISTYDELIPLIASNKNLYLELSSGVSKLYKSVVENHPNMKEEVRISVQRWLSFLENTQNYDKFKKYTEHIFKDN